MASHAHEPAALFHPRILWRTQLVGIHGFNFVFVCSEVENMAHSCKRRIKETESIVAVERQKLVLEMEVARSTSWEDLTTLQDT